jgi:CRISPR-associated protein Cas5d
MLGAYPPLAVKVWGDFACFTRPEMKVERVSYAVMTPSAARGLLESIFWKPAFGWRIRAIHVLKPIRYFSLLRNEVSSAATTRALDGEGSAYVVEDDRAQRHTLALREVAYLIAADIVVRAPMGEDAAKYRDQFRRRLERGQHFIAPYLGCREFFALVASVDGSERPLDLTATLGRMLFDLDYASDGSGRAEPRFFEARLEQGTLHVPSGLYEEMIAPGVQAR